MYTVCVLIVYTIVYGFFLFFLYVDPFINFL